MQRSLPTAMSSADGSKCSFNSYYTVIPGVRDIISGLETMSVLF